MNTIRIFLSIAFLIVTCPVFAGGDGESPWSVQLRSGYNFGMNSSIVGTSDNFNTFGQITMSENIRGSYGRGIPVQIDGLYQVNENTNVGLGLGTQLGSEYTIHEFTEFNGSGETVAKTDLFYINPFVNTKIATLSDVFNLEANLGLIYNTGGTVEETETQSGTDFSGNPFTFEETIETKFDPHLGCNGGVDLVYKVNPVVNILFGVDGRVLRPTEKEAEITTRTVNGVSQLDMMPIYDKQWNFSDDLGEGSNNFQYNPNASVDSPRDVLKAHHDWNSWSLRFGVRYNL